MVEKLRDAQQRAGGPDDDDHAVQLLAAQLRNPNVDPQARKAIEAAFNLAPGESKALEALAVGAGNQAQVRIINSGEDSQDPPRQQQPAGAAPVPGAQQQGNDSQRPRVGKLEADDGKIDAEAQKRKQLVQEAMERLKLAQMLDMDKADPQGMAPECSLAMWLGLGLHMKGGTFFCIVNG